MENHIVLSPSEPTGWEQPSQREGKTKRNTTSGLKAQGKLRGGNLKKVTPAGQNDAGGSRSIIGWESKPA